MSSSDNLSFERTLLDAGLEPGMRVLDVGCGPGKVSLLLSRLVGPDGHVVGIDRNDSALSVARGRVEQQGLSNVEFVQADLSAELPELSPFDAAVGRRVLMYLPDPAQTVTRIAECLRPGGLVVFQETDATMVPGRQKPFPLHDQVLSWIWATVEREGGNPQTGLALPSLLRQAGLEGQGMRGDAVIEGQGSHSLGAIVRAIFPRIVAHDVAKESELDIATLDERLLAELREMQTVYVSAMQFSVWARKPGA